MSIAVNEETLLSDMNLMNTKIGAFIERIQNNQITDEAIMASCAALTLQVELAKLRSLAILNITMTNFNNTVAARLDRIDAAIRD